MLTYKTGWEGASVLAHNMGNEPNSFIICSVAITGFK